MSENLWAMGQDFPAGYPLVRRQKSFLYVNFLSFLEVAMTGSTG